MTHVPRYVVGLTGGIGSGKSAAADEFARLGATVVDADLIAHELTGRGGDAIAGIERVFGKEFLESGALDRKKMREHIFSNPEARKKLEALLHPMIREESARRIAAASTASWWSTAPRSFSSSACARAAASRSARCARS